MDHPPSTLDPMRTWVATHVRRAVTGRNGNVRHRDLFGTEGERWFDDEAVIRRVHADSAMFVGGLRALLLQSLHPLAMAGVAEHSDYRSDPWHRLQRTADFLAATTYGPADEAERAVARVHAVHERVVGVAPDGRSYAANDPHLLRWVHVAEVDSFLAAHQRFGETSLLPHERDEYVRDMAVIARALGVPARLPARAGGDPGGAGSSALHAPAAADAPRDSSDVHRARLGRCRVVAPLGALAVAPAIVPDPGGGCRATRGRCARSRSALGAVRHADPRRGERFAQRVSAASDGARSPRSLTTTRSSPSQVAIDNSSACSSAAT